MTITWYGQAFVRIESRGTVIAIDPFSKQAGWGILKVPRFHADIVLISHDHPDHNNAAALEGSPIVLAGPGEYEVKGIPIRGIPSFHDDVGGRERGPNTIFTIDIEDMRVCHMGDLGMKKLPQDTLEKIGDPDILFIPVGGTYTIDARTAWSIVSDIEPKIVIPIHYKLPGLKLPLESVEKFLKEAGAKPTPGEKLSVRTQTLPAGGPKVELLAPLAFLEGRAGN
jgi:L-ascorbate metabolism protein UlaG (beta-lactamase superfamily)